jgi:hypothetical protein
MFSMNSMKKRIFLRYVIATFILISIGWSVLTIYVEIAGSSKHWTLGNASAEKTALVVFDPDPFYNLDEQICMSFGKSLSEEGVKVLVATVAAADQFKSTDFDVVVYCANSYNWRPDWAITGYVEGGRELRGKKCVAITLGAGSTEASQRHFENKIANAGGTLIGSYSLWLWRPNDETKMEKPNVDMAISMAHDWGKQIATKIK